MQNLQVVNAQSVIACNLGAIDSTFRIAHLSLAAEVFAAVAETKELTDGYAFQLSGGAPMLHKAIDWIANERLCCSFLNFSLAVSEPAWLELRGSPEAKEFMRQNFVETLRETGALPDIEARMPAHLGNS